jgi:hypothetical protein
VSYLHYKIHTGPQHTIHVRLTDKANVRLLDTLNYYKYRAGRPYQAIGESSQDVVVNLKPPHAGEWHVIVDLKGQGEEVRASVELKSEEAPKQGP